MTEQITKHDEAMFKIIKDPVSWAHVHLKMNENDAGPRWYQEQILRHPHNRIVLRCGRRVGKCIAYDQRILNSETGEYKTVDSLYKEKAQDIPIYTLDNDLKNVKSKTFYIEDNGVKPVFRVTTNTGREVKLTKNHPLITIKGWKNLEELDIGMSIGTPKSLPVFGKIAKNPDYAILMGYLASSGKVSKNILQIEITSGDKIVTELERITKALQIKLIQKSKKVYYLIEKDDVFKNIIENFEGMIPEEVFQYNEKTLKYFLTGMFDAKGWITQRGSSQFGVSHRNHEMILDIKHLLLRFGIQSTTTVRSIGLARYHNLVIYRTASTAIFLNELIQDCALRDYSLLEKYKDVTTDKGYTVPKDIWEYIEYQRTEKKLTKTDVAGKDFRRLRKTQDISESMMHEYAKNIDDDYLKLIAESSISWEKIVNIEYIGEEQTYDVYVPETHNLVVEDVFVHNTWTMCAHMLWVAFTGNGGKLPQGATCIVATPYDNQARLIYDQLNQFIDNNDILKESVASRTKNPYFIKFKNGGVIKLFTAGTKSGSGGGSLRGQKADWLYMDKKTLSLYVATHIE